MKTMTVIIIMIFLSQPVSAAFLGHVIVEGIVLGYNSKTVTLSQQGKETKVPRKSIPKHFKIEVGKKVQAIFKGEEVMKKLKKLRKR